MKGGTKNKDLTKREKAFVEHFLRTGQVGESATAAGYSARTAHAAGSRLLRKVKCRAEIDRRRADLNAVDELTTTRIRKELARLCYSDMRRLYNEDGTQKLPHELDDDAAAAVASFESEELFEGSGKARRLIGYTRKVKFFDKNSALEKAMKHKGLFERDNEQVGNAVARVFNIPAKNRGSA